MTWFLLLLSLHSQTVHQFKSVLILYSTVLYSPLGSDLVVEAVQLLGGGAVEVEPPVADEVVLVEESPVGAEEAVLGQTASSVSSADVEDLALSLGVSVVTSVHLAVTRKSRLGHLGVDGIILSGHSGHGFLQHGEVGIR